MLIPFINFALFGAIDFKFHHLLVLFFIIIVGYLSGKIRKIKDNQNKILSDNYFKFLHKNKEIV